MRKKTIVKILMQEGIPEAIQSHAVVKQAGF